MELTVVSKARCTRYGVVSGAYSGRRFVGSYPGRRRVRGLARADAVVASRRTTAWLSRDVSAALGRYTAGWRRAVVVRSERFMLLVAGAIRRYHHLAKLLERCLRLPAELGLGFVGATDQ